MKYEFISENEVKATPDRISGFLGMEVKIYITKLQVYENFQNVFVWYNKKTGNLLHAFSPITKELNNLHRAREFNKDANN